VTGPSRAAALAVATAALALASCGAQHRKSAPGLPSAAEPAGAPVTARAPAGRSVKVGGLPEGIVVDGKTGLVVVGVRNPAQLVLLDARTGRVLRRISIAGAPRHLQLAAAGGPVLVPAEPVNRLLELGLPRGGVRSIPVGAHPHDAAADGRRVFVANEFGQSVSVIQGSRVIASIGGFAQPAGVASLGAKVAVVDVRLNSVTLIDARALAVTGRLAAGAGPTHDVAGLGGRLYVIDTRGGAVFSYQTRPTFRLLNRFSLPGAPYGVAIDRARGRLWVALTAKDELVELATGGQSLRVLGVYETGRQPNTVAVDPRDGRVFVADAGPGTVQVIKPLR